MSRSLPSKVRPKSGIKRRRRRVAQPVFGFSWKEQLAEVDGS